VWHEIIIGLSEGRVAKELRVRERFLSDSTTLKPKKG
jgi:hypothetical protein